MDQDGLLKAPISELVEDRAARITEAQDPETDNGEHCTRQQISQDHPVKGSSEMLCRPVGLDQVCSVDGWAGHYLTLGVSTLGSFVSKKFYE